MHYEAKAGHIGTGLSSIDILTYLYGEWFGEGDRFILSKGHGASALYATLAHFGRISEELVSTYYKDDTTLPAHPAAGALPDIPAATGSLGHGLSIACGLALAFHRSGAAHKRVCCMVSDGECNEGSVWEAAMFASHHKLANLLVVVDANGLQGFGRTSEVLGLEPIGPKFEAFGFDVHEASGHDFLALHKAMSASPTNAPRCIVARTTKGKGVSFMEDRLEWHYLPMNPEQFESAKNELTMVASTEGQL